MITPIGIGPLFTWPPSTRKHCQVNWWHSAVHVANKFFVRHCHKEQWTTFSTWVKIFRFRANQRIVASVHWRWYSTACTSILVGIGRVCGAGSVRTCSTVARVWRRYSVMDWRWISFGVCASAMEPIPPCTDRFCRSMQNGERTKGMSVKFYQKLR